MHPLPERRPSEGGMSASPGSVAKAVSARHVDLGSPLARPAATMAPEQQPSEDPEACPAQPRAETASAPEGPPPAAPAAGGGPTPPHGGASVQTVASDASGSSSTGGPAQASAEGSGVSRRLRREITWAPGLQGP
ncbi:unnamed protein product, partial [Prorocentrum cordatum]